MATTIKGKVTRVLPNQNNFFFRPDEDQDLRHLDIDGHRVGEGEVSAQNINSNKPKLKAWTNDLPKLGDHIELALAKEPE
jgi:hypothetical protein